MHITLYARPNAWYIKNRTISLKIWEVKRLEDNDVVDINISIGTDELIIHKNGKEIKDNVSLKEKNGNQFYIYQY